MKKNKIRENFEELEESDGGAPSGFGGGGGTAFGAEGGSSTYDAPGFGKAKSSIVKKKPYNIPMQDIENQGVVEKYINENAKYIKEHIIKPMILEKYMKEKYIKPKIMEKYIKKNVIRPTVEKYLGKFLN